MVNNEDRPMTRQGRIIAIVVAICTGLASGLAGAVAQHCLEFIFVR